MLWVAAKHKKLLNIQFLAPTQIVPPLHPFSTLQEDRGIFEQDTASNYKVGGVGVGGPRAARHPIQPAQQPFLPLATASKNPQPTMGGKKKNDSKLPTEDMVSDEV